MPLKKQAQGCCVGEVQKLSARWMNEWELYFLPMRQGRFVLIIWCILWPEELIIKEKECCLCFLSNKQVSVENSTELVLRYKGILDLGAERRGLFQKRSYLCIKIHSDSLLMRVLTCHIWTPDLCIFCWCKARMEPTINLWWLLILETKTLERLALCESSLSTGLNSGRLCQRKKCQISQCLFLFLSFS